MTKMCEPSDCVAACWMLSSINTSSTPARTRQLGSASRGRVADHLERIREFEQRAFEMKELDPNAPQLPKDSKLAHGGQADPGW